MKNGRPASPPTCHMTEERSSNEMSTTWYIPIPTTARNAELAIRKITGWKKHTEPTLNPHTQILTDGKHFIHCDRRPITIVDHGRFAVLERFGANYSMEETLEQIDGALNEHSENTVINCDQCGGYMMSDEANVIPDELVVCRICRDKKS